MEHLVLLSGTGRMFRIAHHRGGVDTGDREIGTGGLGLDGDE